MANRGLHEFTVQEATNVDAFVDWNYQTIEMTDETANTVTAITKENPAKKVVIYNKPGQEGTYLDVTDVITLTINGEAAPKEILIANTDLPFTLTGLLITSLTLTSSAGEAGDHISILSFH